MFSFEHIEHLLVLAILPLLVLLYILAVNRKKKIAKKLGDPVLVRALTKQYNPARFTLKFFLVLIAFAAITIAFANIRSADEGESVKRSGIDVMIALDVSNSMMARDITPNRLDRAKQVISRIIDKLDNNRIGLVVFAGKAYLQMPLTADHSAAKMYLSAATPESVPTQGTVISEALKMCYLTFNSEEKKFKSVILLSDGEDHDESATDLAKKMSADGVIIHAVGLGSPAGSPVPDRETGAMKLDNTGNIVVSRLNEDALRKIATVGGGQYQLFTSTDAVVSNIVGQLNTMDQRKIKDESLLNYESFFQIFLAIALLALLIELFISENRKFVAAKKIKPAVTAVVFLLFSFSGFAQKDKELIKTGNEAYKKRNYPAAIDAYRKAAEMNPSNQAAIYNLGNALYKNGDSAKAITAYDMAAKSAKQPIDKSNAYYNKGVVFQNSNRLPECIEAYKNALRINPNDEDARQNLQKALQKQKEDQKDKSDNQDKNKNKSPDKQKSKLSQQDAEDKLNALQQQEKNLHDKLKKVNANATNKPEKDW